MNLGTIEVDIHLNSGAARRLYELAEPIIREMNDPMRLAIALGNLSEIYRLEGDYRRAMATGNESLQLFADIDDPARAAWQLANIALCQSLLRDVAAAFDSMSAAYDLIVRDPNPRWLAWHFDVWFIIAAKLQRWETAARLLGFVDRLRHEKNVPRLPGLLPWFSLPVESLGRALTDERLHDLMLEGEALSVADAQALGADLAAGL
jgi:tetratricopeptide (TPR) repeat protein